MVPPDVWRENVVAMNAAASALPGPAAPAVWLEVIGSSWAFISGMVEQINDRIRSGRAGDARSFYSPTIPTIVNKPLEEHVSQEPQVSLDDLKNEENKGCLD